MTVDYSDLTYSLAGVKRSNPFDRRRQMASAMLQQGMDSSPVQHPLQGASRLAQALVGGWMGGQVDRDESAAVEKQQGALAAAMAEPDPQKRIALLSASNPELGARLSGQLAVEQAKIAQQQAGLQTGGANLAAGYGMSPPGPQQAGAPQGDAASRIAGIESGGKYDAVGPVANQQGHRAYGKFQVLEPNIGPWTLEVLGKAMTPQEFIQNPQAQEAVFKAKFGQMVQKHGSQEAAAREWFAGPGGMNNPNARDVNGMTVQGYSNKFTGGQPQVAQGGNPQAAPGMPPQPTTQGVQGPAVIAPPQIPDVPRPQPSHQVVQKHLQILQTGGYGVGPEAQARARAAIEAEVDRDWQVQRDRSKMEFQQRSQLAQEDRAGQRAEEKRQREVAGPTPKDMQDLRTARSDAIGIVASLNDFKKSFENAGTLESAKSAMGFNTPLNTSWNSAALLAKGESLFNLGVLNGPDLEILRRALPDPSTFKGATTSAEGMKASVDKIIDLVQTRIAAKERQVGLPPTDMRKETETTQQTQPGAPPPTGGGITLDAIDAEIARRKGGR
jgi:hypothetical protein